MQTAEIVKNNIRSRLQEMIESRHALLNHANFLSSLGVEIKDNRLHLCRCFESVAKTYIDGLCQKLTQEHANGTPAKIKIDPELYCIIGSRAASRALSLLFNNADDYSLDDEKSLIDKYLTEIDFECIADEINTQAEQLKDTGIGIFARQIIDQMNLSNLDGYYSPYRKNSRIICKTWAFNYLHNHSEISKLETLKNAFNAIEEDAGITFGPSIREYIFAAGKLHWKCEKIPSRTIFGKGGHLEIHCFKDKHEYRFSSQAFDALMAFLTINGKSDVVDNIMEKTDFMEAV